MLKGTNTLKKKNNASGVLYRTSDGVDFLEISFATAHANKNGLTIKTIKKPKIKTLKNGLK